MLNILIVDDDALHGRSVRDLLAAHNYLADVESSGHGGLERLLQAEAAGTPYQVLILDLHTPDLAGIEVLAEIQTHQLNVKTIILSGEEQLDSVAPILKLGACDYIRKPFDADELINRLSIALSRYQLAQEKARMQRAAKKKRRPVQVSPQCLARSRLHVGRK